MSPAPADPLVGTGQQLPDIALPDLDGRTQRLSEYRGRKLLLFMWASW